MHWCLAHTTYSVAIYTTYLTWIGVLHISLWQKHVFETFPDHHIVHLSNALCAIPFWRCLKWWCSCCHYHSLVCLSFAASIFVKQIPSCSHLPDRYKSLDFIGAFIRELLSELPKFHGFYNIPWFVQLALSAFYIHAICHYNIQQFHMINWRVPVLASGVSHICVLREVINTVNLEVHVEVQLYWIVHINDLFVFVISEYSFLCLLKDRTLGYNIEILDVTQISRLERHMNCIVCTVCL